MFPQKTLARKGLICFLRELHVFCMQCVLLGGLYLRDKCLVPEKQNDSITVKPLI